MIKIKKSLKRIVESISQYYHLTFRYPNDEIFDVEYGLLMLNICLNAQSKIENVELKNSTKEPIELFIIKLNNRIHKLIEALLRVNFRNKFDAAIEKMQRILNDELNYSKLQEDRTGIMIKIHKILISLQKY